MDSGAVAIAAAAATTTAAAAATLPLSKDANDLDMLSVLLFISNVDFAWLICVKLPFLQFEVVLIAVFSLLLEHGDGAGYPKLYVASVPRTATIDDVSNPSTKHKCWLKELCARTIHRLLALAFYHTEVCMYL